VPENRHGHWAELRDFARGFLYPAKKRPQAASRPYSAAPRISREGAAGGPVADDLAFHPVGCSLSQLNASTGPNNGGMM